MKIRIQVLGAMSVLCFLGCQSPKPLDWNNDSSTREESGSEDQEDNADTDLPQPPDGPSPGQPLPPLPPLEGKGNGYFEALVALPEHWKSYSLRDPNQVKRRSEGGYITCSSCPLFISYDPARDYDPHRQDAAKVVIPAFTPDSITALAVSVSTIQKNFPVTVWNNNFYLGRAFKIDQEIIKVETADELNKTITVSRGVAGSIASPHAANTKMYLNINSLISQIRVPLNTEDGNTYIFTWDGYWTDSYINSGLTNHKAFQFSSGRDTIWLEPNTLFSGATSASFNKALHVASCGIRSYNFLGGDADYSKSPLNTLGPGVTANTPLSPRVGEFNIKPNTWTRFWVRIEQRANDYDYMDFWVADEVTDAIQIYSRIPLSVRPDSTTGVHTIQNFWLEFNTSTDLFVRGDSRDLVAYVRNIVGLRTNSDPKNILQRPKP
jgi:hypothetical protein